jgi:hypothetical protein
VAPGETKAFIILDLGELYAQAASFIYMSLFVHFTASSIVALYR